MMITNNFYLNLNDVHPCAYYNAYNISLIITFSKLQSYGDYGNLYLTFMETGTVLTLVANILTGEILV